jgi:hypothetical protein
MNCAAKCCIWSLLFVAVTTPVWAQKSGVPRYCKTDAGILGPYPNDGSVGVGDPCYGTKNGKRYEGVAVMSRGASDDNAGGGGASEKKGGVPRYCKTDAGVLGPYPNDGSVGVGDPCYGTKNGKRYEGVAVVTRGGSDDDAGGGASEKKGGVPRYCKTDAGVLGPYPNDGSVGVGDPCYGTKNGKRYEGVAVMSPSED